MSKTVLLLLKNEILRNVRKKFILKFLFGNSIPIERVLSYYFIFVSIYFGFTSIFPLLSYYSFEFVLPNADNLAQYYHFIFNGIMFLYMFCGLFVGATLIYNLNIEENEQLLSLPVLIDDLVQYRLWDVIFVNLKTFIFFLCPFLLYLFISIGWSFYWVLLIVILTIVMALFLYLLGIWIILLISKLMPSLSSDKIFINVFLVSIMFFVGFIRLFKNGYIGNGYTSIWSWLGDLLSTSSISVWVESIVVMPLGFPLYLLVISGCCIAVYNLWKFSSQTLNKIYQKIHFPTVQTQINRKQITYSLTFEKLNKFIHFIPSFPRIILVRDILLLIRNKNLLIKIIIFVVGLIFLSNLKSTYVDNPLLFVLYFSSLFIILRLFIGVVGSERNNILNIKLLAPSIPKYLSERIKIALIVSLVILVPIWIVLIGISGDFAILSSFYRIPFLILNVLFSSILVIYYSASFAEFESNIADNSDNFINPVAMLFFWGLGLILSLLFYKLDLIVSYGVYDFASLFFVSVMGLIILISILLCRYLGIRRIKNYF